MADKQHKRPAAATDGRADDGPGAAFDFSLILGIADMLPVMIAYLDRDFHYRFVNKPYAEWMERPRSEMLGRSVSEVLGEEAFKEREPMLNAAFGGERQLFVSTFDHPNRGPLAVQAEYVPQVGPDGTVLGIAALITDVTEQRAAERALRESEERFRRIANQAPVMMWVTRLDRTRDFVNDAYVEFLGLDREEARTFDWREAIHPGDVDRIVAESIAGEETRASFTLEGRYCRHDREWRWIKSVSSPRFGPDGELIGFIGAGTDITVTKEAELELKRQVEERTAQLAASEARVRGLFDSALEMIGLLDLDGGYLEINRSARDALGLNAEQVTGMRPWEIHPFARFPDSQAKLKSLVRRAAAGETAKEELQVETVEGTASLIVSMKPVPGPDGKPLFLLGEGRDITELKAAQEQLRQSQKMEALGQLTGGIAHDFNNLLTVVVGGLDLLSKRVEDPKLKRYATNALTAAERGARLTGQLLAFSRVQRLEVVPTRIVPLIENMRPLLRNVLGPGIEKRFSLEEGRATVMADPTQLEVAVLNLAINARDAMPEGGVLTFATRQVTITNDSDLDPGDFVELCISDTGSGMNEEVRERAFEPFFTTKDVGKGTGLGLSMVYGMARQSGGIARIDSEPGKGTTVRIYFRSAEHQPAKAGVAGSDSSDSPAESRRGRILVVDDDPDVRGFIVEALSDLGYSMCEAADGASGLEAFAAHKPDLVVLDFIMPGLSGADVAREILQVDPDQLILFVSGYSETDAIRDIAPGAPLLTKPFRSEALGRAVRHAIAGSEGDTA